MAEAPTNTAATTEQPWQTPQYEVALAHLERLQDQLDSLRPTLSNMIAPLGQRHTSRQQVFAGLKKAAVASTVDVKAFREIWEGEQTREVFARVKESEGRDGDLSTGGEVASHGWREGEEKA